MAKRVYVQKPVSLDEQIKFAVGLVAQHEKAVADRTRELDRARSYLGKHDGRLGMARTVTQFDVEKAEQLLAQDIYGLIVNLENLAELQAQAEVG